MDSFDFQAYKVIDLKDFHVISHAYKTRVVEVLLFFSVVQNEDQDLECILI